MEVVFVASIRRNRTGAISSTPQAHEMAFLYGDLRGPKNSIVNHSITFSTYFCVVTPIS